MMDAESGRIFKRCCGGLHYPKSLIHIQSEPEAFETRLQRLTLQKFLDYHMLVHTCVIDAKTSEIPDHVWMVHRLEKGHSLFMVAPLLPVVVRHVLDFQRDPIAFLGYPRSGIHAHSPPYAPLGSVAYDLLEPKTSKQLFCGLAHYLLFRRVKMPLTILPSTPDSGEGPPSSMPSGDSAKHEESSSPSSVMVAVCGFVEKVSAKA